jgi:hypothetical protein
VLQAPPVLQVIRTRPEHHPATAQLQPQHTMPALPFNLVRQAQPLPVPAPVRP